MFRFFFDQLLLKLLCVGTGKNEKQTCAPVLVACSPVDVAVCIAATCRDIFGRCVIGHDVGSCIESAAHTPYNTGAV